MIDLNHTDISSAICLPTILLVMFFCFVFSFPLVEKSIDWIFLIRPLYRITHCDYSP